MTHTADALLLLIILLFLGVIPVWPYSKGWGYYPSGGMGLLFILLFLYLIL